MRSQMTNEQRALQFWSVLVLAARSQQLLSYKSMEKLTGIPKQGVGRVLAPIQAYCKRNKLPPLTALVINEDEGLPGLGLRVRRKAIFLPPNPACLYLIGLPRRFQLPMSSAFEKIGDSSGRL